MACVPHLSSPLITESLNNNTTVSDSLTDKSY